MKSETTERERSPVVEEAQELVLHWVWPERRVQRLAGATLTIGRDPDASIQLSGKGVSRRHAQLNRQGPIYAVQDLGSTNGTRLNGRSVDHAPIQANAVLRIGEWVGVFERGSPAQFGELLPGTWGGGALARALETFCASARSELPLLLIGATGTGKERLARAAHELSGRSGPFLAINCGALPEGLAEAELFGYRRGAFTGADRPNQGLLRAAHGGTLFLDEMPELSLSLQAKLLRVLEDRHVPALGETKSVYVDLRIVSTSQVPPSELVAAGRMRRDFCARVAGIEVNLPLLSERRSDVALLFKHFLNVNSGGRPPEVEPMLVEALCLHAWPENVRELQTLTRRLLALHGHGPRLELRHLNDTMAALVRRPEERSRTDDRGVDRAQYERNRVESELGRNGGNVKAAAEALGLSRQRVYRLLGRREGRGDAHDN